MVWSFLGFMALGGLIVALFDYRAWKMYLQGRNDPCRRNEPKGPYKR